MAGTLYFIQPAELVGTNRYKIGCSAGMDLIRCKSYKQGTRYIMVLECNQPFVVEKEVKLRFNERFSRIAGKEYFEGNEKEMRDLFYHIFLQFEGRAVMETEEFPMKRKRCDDLEFMEDTDFKFRKSTPDEDLLKNATYRVMDGQIHTKGGKTFNTLDLWIAECGKSGKSKVKLSQIYYFKDSQWVKFDL
jgi:hypothetical protein